MPALDPADAFYMSTTTRALAVVAAVGALAVTSADAAPNLSSPGSGASMTTTHPAFSWALPSGETALSISVARSSTINPSTDDFMPGELAQIGMLTGDATKWTPSRPMPAGKYYWHVASRAGAQNRVYSSVGSFVIRPLISKILITATSSYGRMFLITTSWAANEQKVDYIARLYQGSKRLGERKLTTDNFLIDSRKQDLSTWVLPETVKKGARLRFVVTLKSEGGAKASKSKSLRAP
jgi:hypothetical protein